MLRAILCVLLASAPAAAAERSAPLPPQRPTDAAADHGPGSGSPLPPERPVELGYSPETSSISAVPLPPVRPLGLGSGEASTAPGVQRNVAEQDDDAGCEERLARLGVRAKELPPIEEGACGASKPFEVSGLPDGVEVSPPVTLTCAAAEALALWSRDVVTAAAEKDLSAAPRRIAIGTSYQCRTQNHQQGAKLSEHAFANGVDVAGFDFFKRGSVTIGKADPEGPDGRFAGEVRTGACGYFTTVLGPGANPEHADHLHLDLRGRKNGYRICQ